MCVIRTDTSCYCCKTLAKHSLVNAAVSVAERYEAWVTRTGGVKLRKSECEYDSGIFVEKNDNGKYVVVEFFCLTQGLGEARISMTNAKGSRPKKLKNLYSQGNHQHSSMEATGHIQVILQKHLPTLERDASNG